jgi:hypothetical protein
MTTENKGVISKVMEDDEMPFLANGKKVDLILNALGVVNRLNSGQLYEQSINFICNLVADKLKTLNTMKEKEDLVFDIVGRLNEKQVVELKKYYNSLSNEEKKCFFNDIDTDGMYIHIPPLWETKSMFERIKGIYDVYDWIKPVDVYINKFGRTIKIMKPMIIGELYVMKLKQNSKKNFSARSVGAISRKGLPDKSYKSKSNQDLYSSTPIRIGVQENYNSFIGVNPKDAALMHMFYRSSPVARLELGKRLMSSVKELKKLKTNKRIKNRNAEILSVYLKALGLRYEFLDDREYIKIYTDDVKDRKLPNGNMFIGTDDEYEDKLLHLKIENDFKNEFCYIGTPEEVSSKINDEFERAKKKRDYEIYIDINE